MTARESTYNQAMNIEGEALKKMAGATKGGGLSAVTGWLAARGKDKDRKGSGKTAADWENQETARKLEYGRQKESESRARLAEERAKRADFGREEGRSQRAIDTARTNKLEGLGLKGVSSSTPSAGRYDVSLYQSSGGQGTTGNTRGRQFGKPAPAPSLPGPGGRRVSNPAYVKWKSEQ